MSEDLMGRRTVLKEDELYTIRVQWALVITDHRGEWCPLLTIVPYS